MKSIKRQMRQDWLRMYNLDLPHHKQLFNHFQIRIVNVLEEFLQVRKEAGDYQQRIDPLRKVSNPAARKLMS